LQPRMCRRSEEESSGLDVSSVWKGVYPKDVRGSQKRRCFLLRHLLERASVSGVQDPCVRLLREEVCSTGVGDQEVEVGQILLFTGVLAVGSRLYDLTVEDDHSFVAAGMVVHNSNCRDRLFIRRVPHEVEEVDAHGALVQRDKNVRDLRKIKHQGHL
jgi:hypothetical protein